MRIVNYIDPGTGTAIISSIWPAILAFFSAIFAVLLRIFWHPIKRFFSRQKEEKPQERRHDKNITTGQQNPQN